MRVLRSQHLVPDVDLLHTDPALNSVAQNNMHPLCSHVCSWEVTRTSGRIGSVASLGWKSLFQDAPAQSRKLAMAALGAGVGLGSGDLMAAHVHLSSASIAVRQLRCESKDKTQKVPDTSLEVPIPSTSRCHF